MKKVLTWVFVIILAVYLMIPFILLSIWNFKLAEKYSDAQCDFVDENIVEL